MEDYGSDKPDLRIDLLVHDVTELLSGCGFGPFENGVVKAVPVSGCGLARKAIDKIVAQVEVQTAQKCYWFKLDEKGGIAGGIAKFINAVPGLAQQVAEALKLEPNALVMLAAGPKLTAQKTAGVARKLLGAACPEHMDEKRYELCWIVDFPMFEIGEESGQLE